MVVRNGRCLCGEIAYAVSAQPRHVTYCHCRFCQRATGSAFMVEPVFDRSSLDVISGEPKVYEHRSQGSGKLVSVHFCATCGTKLFLSFERFVDVVGVYAGTFDKPDWFERRAANSKHIFLEVAQHGTVVPAGVATYRQHATTNAGEPVAPTVFAAPVVIGED